MPSVTILQTNCGSNCWSLITRLESTVRFLTADVWGCSDFLYDDDLVCIRVSYSYWKGIYAYGTTEDIHSILIFSRYSIWLIWYFACTLGYILPTQVLYNISLDCARYPKARGRVISQSPWVSIPRHTLRTSLWLVVSLLWSDGSQAWHGNQGSRRGCGSEKYWYILIHSVCLGGCSRNLFPCLSSVTGTGSIPKYKPKGNQYHHHFSKRPTS